MKGWHREPTRHALARYGVRTGRQEYLLKGKERRLPPEEEEGGVTYAMTMTIRGQKGTFPVRIEKAFDDRWETIGHVICPKCKVRVKSAYFCPKCELQASIGQFPTREAYVGAKRVIYEEEQRRDFVRSKVEKKIDVMEVGCEDIHPWVFTAGDKTYELYNNERAYRDLVGNMWKYMVKGKKAFIGTMGFPAGGRVMGIIILPTQDGRVVFKEVKDLELLREPRQKDRQRLETSIDKVMKRISVNPLAELNKEFLEKVAKGEKIVIQKRIPKEEEKNVEVLKRALAVKGKTFGLTYMGWR